MVLSAGGLAARLKAQFKQLLEDNHHVHPGKSLGEVTIFFIGRECFSSLGEKDKQEVYEAHQAALRQRARSQLLELLAEQAELLQRFSLHHISSDDIQLIHERLQAEPRCAPLSLTLSRTRTVMQTSMSDMAILDN